MSRVVHFEIHATDPDAAAKFYTEVFGWKIEKWASDAIEYWVVYTGEKTKPGIDGGIIRRHGAAPTEGQAVNAFVSTMEVEDIDAIIEKVLANGGSIALAKSQIGDGTSWAAWQGYCKDLEGNIFGLHQVIKKTE